MRAPNGNVLEQGTANGDSLDFSGLANSYHGVDWVTLGGNDKVYGTMYDDNFTLGADVEFIDGVAGVDTVNYSNSTAGVDVNLNNSVQQGGFAQGDMLRHIENVTGSRYTDALVGDAGANVLDGQGGNDKIYGGDGNDSLLGGDGNDFLSGDAGNDLLRGGNGNDILSGGTGNDTFLGDAGDDVMRGGAGADRYDGGIGSDTVDYSAAPSATPFFGFNGVWVDLVLGQGALDGDASGDTYVGVENVRGSAYNDFLQGDALANVLSGNGGDDWIVGGAGADSLDGGDGVDAVSYYNSAAGVHIDLASNQASGGDAEGDTIVNFEIVDGSDSGDQLFAADGGSTLIGRGGSDFIAGRAGSDRIQGDAGNDFLVGGGSSDTFVFDAIRNNFSMQQGSDTIADFIVGVDHLEFAGDNVESVSDLGFLQNGSNTIISYNDGGAAASITLLNVNTSQLLAHAQTDFLFT